MKNSRGLRNGVQGQNFKAHGVCVGGGAGGVSRPPQRGSQALPIFPYPSEVFCLVSLILEGNA